MYPTIQENIESCNHISSVRFYKIFHNPSHPLHSDLPELFQPVRFTRYALNSNSLSFSSIRLSTAQYSRSFIPATTKLWNSLPSVIFESSELQNFELGANTFLLDKDN